MFDWIATLPGMVLTAGVTLVGLSALGPAVDGYAQPHREAAKIQCYAQAQAYQQEQRAAAEAACAVKKLAEIEKQIAPAKALVSSLSF